MVVHTVKAIFSDLDGTLCHFDRDTSKHGVVTTEEEGGGYAKVFNAEGDERRCRLLPTSTMGNGVVSRETADLVSKLRAAGVKFVVVSGARNTTILKRIPLLPHVDAAVSETGSRIMYAPVGGSAFVPEKDADPSLMSLDVDWAARFEHITGPLSSALPAEEREGTLWDLFRELKAMGLKVDANGYTGCFRVDCKTPQHVEMITRVAGDAEGLAKRELGHAMNLGKYDFFPAMAGKGNTVKYLQEKWGLKKEECVALFDDDNDLPMAEACGAGMLPSVTSNSVRARLGSEPDWILAERAGTGVFATEELLERILKQVQEASGVGDEACRTGGGIQF